jgi:hypothetical protein
MRAVEERKRLEEMLREGVVGDGVFTGSSSPVVGDAFGGDLPLLASRLRRLGLRRPEKKNVERPCGGRRDGADATGSDCSTSPSYSSSSAGAVILTGGATFGALFIVSTRAFFSDVRSVSRGLVPRAAVGLSH